MNARELATHINYTGMERKARKIVIQNELATSEEVALMTDLDVYGKLLMKYDVAMCADDRILLIDREYIDDFNDIAVCLTR